MTLLQHIADLITNIGADVKALAGIAAGKQPTLVSGTNIKTVNSTSLLGSGDLQIGTTGVYIPTIATVSVAQTSTSTTVASITSLVGAMVAGATYEVEAFVIYQTTATAVGFKLGYSSPTASTVQVEIEIPNSNTAAASALRTIFPSATSTITGSVASTTVSSANIDQTAHLRGYVTCGTTAGNFQLTFAVGTASYTATVRPGSLLMMRRIA